MKLKLVYLIGFLFCSASMAQNTLSLSVNEKSPEAKIEDVAWIEGYWRGEAFGGIAEEIWSEPLGGSMMGSFKLVSGEKVGFYEIMAIMEENGSLVLKLKHFNADLTGWEEKNETVDFALVKITENEAFFDKLTFRRINEKKMDVFVVVSEGEKPEEVKFSYSRFK